MPVLQRDYLPEDCETSWQAAQVQAVVAVQARAVVEETDFLLNLAELHPAVSGVVGWVDLASTNMAQRLSEWADRPKLRGFRHLLQDEPDVARWLDSPQIRRNLQRLQTHRLTYDVLVFAHQLADVMPFCATHDAHWLVLDHLGKPALCQWLSNQVAKDQWRRAVRELAAMPHVMCKLSGLVTQTRWQSQFAFTDHDIKHMLFCFDEALASFGPQRLMFGSDWPVCQLAASYDGVHGLVRQWAFSRLSDSEQADFWRNNAIRCYGLTLPTLMP